jgi:glycosyltransferase involved in cell wall biosynthesis
VSSPFHIAAGESLAHCPRAVVVMAGARDRYQVPLALAQGDLLAELVTDIYWPADRRWFQRTAGAILSAETVSKRFCPELGSSHVRRSSPAAVATLLTRSLPRLEFNRVKDRALSRKARKIAAENHAALLCYSYYASEAFRHGEGLPYRFLFQVHPHPRSVRRELLEELERVPTARASLRAELELSLNSTDFERLATEPHLANGWVAASTYTAHTLSEPGVPAQNIQVVPYGVDGASFPERVRSSSPSGPYTVVYVGSMVQRKGISYVLDAVRSIGRQHVRVVLCGRGFIDRDLLAQYDDLDLDIRVGLSNAGLVRVLHGCDVFVLPSLAEGFGHVILEAMSCGLPVIATPHTCAPDVIEDGVQGFIVPVRDGRAIEEKLTWGLDHREELAVMGELAAVRARQFTWQRFRLGIRYAYAAMVESLRASNDRSHPG